MTEQKKKPSRKAKHANDEPVPLHVLNRQAKEARQAARDAEQRVADAAVEAYRESRKDTGVGRG